MTIVVPCDYRIKVERMIDQKMLRWLNMYVAFRIFFKDMNIVTAINNVGLLKNISGGETLNLIAKNVIL